VGLNKLKGSLKGTLAFTGHDLNSIDSTPTYTLRLNKSCIIRTHPIINMISLVAIIKLILVARSLGKHLCVNLAFANTFLFQHLIVLREATSGLLFNDELSRMAAYMVHETNSTCYPTLAMILNMSIKLDIYPTVCGRGERCDEVGGY